MIQCFNFGELAANSGDNGTNHKFIDHTINTSLYHLTSFFKQFFSPSIHGCFKVTVSFKEEKAMAPHSNTLA